MTEKQARELKKCPCCFNNKSTGLVVCWDCFKHQPKHSALVMTGFKQWTGTLEEFINISYIPF